MTAWGVDILFIAVLLIVACAMAMFGAVRAGAMAVGVVFAGLLAMNYFEPLSDSLVRMIGENAAVSRYGDVVSLIGLFVTGVLAIRMIVSRLLRESPELPPLLERVGAWAGGAFVGGVTAAVLLTAVHTIPGPRDFWGYFPPEREQRTGPIAGWGPDICWLGFTQHVSEHIFRVGDGDRVFDGPLLKIGEHHDRWPTFIHRYATWRERLAKE